MVTSTPSFAYADRCCRCSSHRHPDVGEVDPVLLSRREREILQASSRGLGDREIAEQLHLSPYTVHWHVANIRRKLGRSRGPPLLQRRRVSDCCEWPKTASSERWFR